MFTLTLIYITCYKTTYVTGMRNRTFVPINTPPLFCMTNCAFTTTIFITGLH